MAAAALMISEPASQVLFQVLFIAIPALSGPPNQA